MREALYRYGALHAWQDGAEMARGLLELFADILPVTAADMELAVQLFA